MAAFLGVAPAHSQTGFAVSQFAQVDQFFEDTLQQYSIPGAAVAIAKDGRLLLARGYGLADVDGGQAVQPDSLFRMHSITKSVTACAVMLLHEQAKVDLDARVFDLLGLQPYNGRWGDARLHDITVRHLLQHSGGWDEALTYDPMAYPILQRVADATGSAYPPSRETLIRYMLAQPLQFTPGSRYAYSNFGYLLLGRVVEKVSGKNYEQYIQDELMRPLGIQREGIITGGPDSTLPGLVHYYDYPGAPLEQSTYTRTPLLVPRPYSFWYGDSDGGFATSVVDLTYFLSSLSGAAAPRILSQTSLDAMLASPPAQLRINPTYWYGLGLFVNDESVGLIWSHSGTSPGGRAVFFRLPNGVVYAYAFNSRDQNDQAWNDLQARLLPYLGLKTDWPDHDLFPEYFPPSPTTAVNAASFLPGPMAPDSLISVFGSHLATRTETAATLPLPSELGNLSASVRDANGTEHTLLLVFASGTQVNLYIPTQVAPGPAVVLLKRTSQPEVTLPLEISAVSPGLFTVNAEGLPAAVVTRVRADGSRAAEVVSGPIRPAEPGEEIWLSLYGTGIRHMASVSVFFNDRMVSADWAGPQPQYSGLDQVDVKVPDGLVGSTRVSVGTAGARSNAALLNFE
jgi:uncharacterized protein (TIGR03437 family)